MLFFQNVQCLRGVSNNGSQKFGDFQQEELRLQLETKALILGGGRNRICGVKNNDSLSKRFFFYVTRYPGHFTGSLTLALPEELVEIYLTNERRLALLLPVSVI